MDHKAHSRMLEGADTAVLLVHGIVGTPRHFDPLIDLIPDNWSICNILLDGHGGKVQDFSRTCMAKWKQQVRQQLEQLCAGHKKVLVVGHSMGTLLAMEAAREFHQVKRLFLLNVPLHPRLTPATAVRALKLALGYLPQSDPLYGACSVRPTPKLWQYLGWIPRYLELFSLCAESRRRIGGLKIKTWAFQAGKDELVSPRSGKYLQGHPHIQYRLFPNGSHFCYPGEELAAIRSQLALCIDEISMLHFEEM